MTTLFLGHLKEKGSSVSFLQGLLQLFHIPLQLQVLIPGIFHLLLAKKTLLVPRFPQPSPLENTHTPKLITTR